MDKVAFEKLIDSLKKFARPELFEEGADILDELYTDLLANDLILKKCLKDRTTLLIGRKGTGKSTLFLKIENEIAKKDDQISWANSNMRCDSFKSLMIINKLSKFL